MSKRKSRNASRYSSSKKAIGNAGIEDSPSRHWVKTSRTWMIAGIAGMAGIAGAWLYLSRGPAIPKSASVDEKLAPPSAQYIGAKACGGCHAEAFQAWSGSHHALAMQEVNEKTVLGDFNNASFQYAGVASQFFRRDGRFFVRTDGPDGKVADFAVKYTFGVAPLQQYLVELTGGRLQALSIAWDSRSKEQGGQRWFHLYPNERITHDDQLHWTRRTQNWNFMCAECHSTNLEKNYDPVERKYRTSWSEISVSCEACHGPGSRHVAWAGKKAWWESSSDRSMGLAIVLNERRNIRWSLDPGTGNSRRSEARNTETEIQLCARCHSRRAQLFGDYRHGRLLMDTHLPSLLVEGAYHADGQIDGEVYEYGSFIQSKMYQAGVTCGDCHEPHSLKLRAAGNALCHQCHSAAKYGTAKHHFHTEGKEGSKCVDCHMPAKNYMVIDPRHDHSFRIPRPDLSVRIGTPNACSGCHKDRPFQWVARKAREWYGTELKGYQRYAEAVQAGRVAGVDAEARLIALSRDNGQPAIARATAVMELASRLSPQSINAVTDALGDADPVVRAAALEALERVAPDQRWQLARHLLRDRVRAVRARAAGLLAGVRGDSLAPAERVELERASDEYLAAQRHNADDPAAHVNIGNFYAVRGDGGRAEEAYRAALDLDPRWVPAYVNLADLMRQNNRDAEGEKILRAGIAREPGAAALYHSLGLAQVRQKNLHAAVASLKRAAELAPRETRYSYVYAVALHDSGQTDAALSQVDAALRRAPGDRALNELRMQLAVGK